jgi:hypothetical protein
LLDQRSATSTLQPKCIAWGFAPLFQLNTQQWVHKCCCDDPGGSGYNEEKGSEVSEFETVNHWMAVLRHELDLEGLDEVDIAHMLRVVREVAHGVIHPAGPVAMLAAGYAVARAGGSSQELQAILADISELAQSYAESPQAVETV